MNKNAIKCHLVNIEVRVLMWRCDHLLVSSNNFGNNFVELLEQENT